MAKRKIIWTTRANIERKEILEYWIGRNKSITYSLKLNKLFINSVNRLSENPLIGRKTDFEDVRVKIVRDYLLLYQFSKSELRLLSIWDSRRDESKIEI